MSELKGPDVNVEAQDLKYTPERAEQLLQNYRRVLERIRAAEQDRSGVRTEQSAPVRLVTVTKFFPASDAAALLDGGVTLFGENRDQEASAKARELAAYCEQRAVQPPHWAFIGQLQTNKAKSVVKYASSVHSVDRPSLADALAKAYANQLTRYEAGEAPAPEGRGASPKGQPKGRPFGPDADLHRVAGRPPGFTGADLANVLNEAALLCAVPAPS